MIEEKDALVRLNPYRTKKLEEVMAIMSKQYTRNIEKPEAVEKLADLFLESKTNES